MASRDLRSAATLGAVGGRGSRSGVGMAGSSASNGNANSLGREGQGSESEDQNPDYDEDSASSGLQQQAVGLTSEVKAAGFETPILPPSATATATATVREKGGVYAKGTKLSGSAGKTSSTTASGSASAGLTGSGKKKNGKSGANTKGDKGISGELSTPLLPLLSASTRKTVLPPPPPPLRPPFTDSKTANITSASANQTPRTPAAGLIARSTSRSITGLGSTSTELARRSKFRIDDIRSGNSERGRALRSGAKSVVPSSVGSVNSSGLASETVVVKEKRKELGSAKGKRKEVEEIEVAEQSSIVLRKRGARAEQDPISKSSNAEASLIRRASARIPESALGETTLRGEEDLGEGRSKPQSKIVKLCFKPRVLEKRFGAAKTSEVAAKSSNKVAAVHKSKSSKRRSEVELLRDGLSVEFEVKTLASALKPVVQEATKSKRPKLGAEPASRKSVAISSEKSRRRSEIDLLKDDSLIAKSQPKSLLPAKRKLDTKLEEDTQASSNLRKKPSKSILRGEEPQSDVLDKPNLQVKKPRKRKSESEVLPEAQRGTAFELPVGYLELEGRGGRSLKTAPKSVAQTGARSSEQNSRERAVIKRTFQRSKSSLSRAKSQVNSQSQDLAEGSESIVEDQSKAGEVKTVLPKRLSSILSRTESSNRVEPLPPSSQVEEPELNGTSSQVETLKQTVVSRPNFRVQSSLISIRGKEGSELNEESIEVEVPPSKGPAARAKSRAEPLRSIKSSNIQIGTQSAVQIEIQVAPHGESILVEVTKSKSPVSHAKSRAFSSGGKTSTGQVVESQTLIHQDPVVPRTTSTRSVLSQTHPQPPLKSQTSKIRSKAASQASLNQYSEKFEQSESDSDLAPNTICLTKYLKDEDIIKIMPDLDELVLTRARRRAEGPRAERLISRRRSSSHKITGAQRIGLVNEVAEISSGSSFAAKPSSPTHIQIDTTHSHAIPLRAKLDDGSSKDSSKGKGKKDKPLERNIDNVIFGDVTFKAWYPSWYPKEIIGEKGLNGDCKGIVVPDLYVCNKCFGYAKTAVDWVRHTRCCEKDVPGEKVYTHGPAGIWSVWEVDGDVDTLFCQNLSLFAKLFLDNKSVFFDVSGFKYFLLVHTSPTTSQNQVVGFFSKEKMSWDNNNLACILVFPPWQRKSLGTLLMGISYAISRREQILGGPEKPISDLGKKGYKRYWGAEIARWLLTCKESDRKKGRGMVTVGMVSKGTWIVQEDCLTVLREMGVLEKGGRGKGVVERVRVDKEKVREWVVRERIGLERVIDEGGFVEGYALADAETVAEAEVDEEEEEGEEDVEMEE